MMLRIGNKKKQSAGCRVQSTEKKLKPDPLALKPEKGLTLIEVLLAVSILGIGLVGVLRGYASSIATLEAGQFSIDAVSLLKQKMAEVEIMIGEQEEISQASQQGHFSDAFEDFLWEWNIKATGTEGLYALTLVVSHKYNPRTFSLDTYVADKKDEEKEEN